MKKSDLDSFFGCYKNAFEDLDDSKRAAFNWFVNFVWLFLLPVVYPCLWLYLTLKGDGDE